MEVMARNQTTLRGFVDLSQLLFQFAVQTRFRLLSLTFSLFLFCCGSDEVAGLTQF